MLLSPHAPKDADLAGSIHVGPTFYDSGPTALMEGTDLALHRHLSSPSDDREGHRIPQAGRHALVIKRFPSTEVSLPQRAWRELYSFLYIQKLHDVAGLCVGLPAFRSLCIEPPAMDTFGVTRGGAVNLVSVKREGATLENCFQQLPFRSASGSNAVHKVQPVLMDIAEQLLRLVDCMHCIGVGCRVLCPSNILLSKQSEGPWWTVSLVGLDHLLPFCDVRSAIEANGSTASFQPLPFTSPEVMCGGCNSPELVKLSDSWAIGCILFQIATGKVLFSIDDDSVSSSPDPPAAYMLAAIAEQLGPGILSDEFFTDLTIFKRLIKSDVVEEFMLMNPASMEANEDGAEGAGHISPSSALGLLKLKFPVFGELVCSLLYPNPTDRPSANEALERYAEDFSHGHRSELMKELRHLWQQVRTRPASQLPSSSGSADPSFFLHLQVDEELFRLISALMDRIAPVVGVAVANEALSWWMEDHRKRQTTSVTTSTAPLARKLIETGQALNRLIAASIATFKRLRDDYQDERDGALLVNAMLALAMEDGKLAKYIIAKTLPVKQAELQLLDGCYSASADMLCVCGVSGRVQELKVLLSTLDAAASATDSLWRLVLQWRLLPGSQAPSTAPSLHSLLEDWKVADAKAGVVATRALQQLQ